MRQGIIHIGASYINDNTSVSADEEFAAFFGPTKRIEKLTGVKFDTVMQVDIPGMSWGVVPAAALHGIPYALLFNNGGDRVGLSMELSHRPFWWVGQDGKSKVLCLQPGSYAPCAQIKGKFYWPARMGETDRAKLSGVVKSANPRANFIDDYLWKSLEQLEKDPLYPYDIFPMSWALADNMPVDADVPDAVKSWNEEYAYPRVVIATSHDIMAAFDSKYREDDSRPHRRIHRILDRRPGLRRKADQHEPPRRRNASSRPTHFGRCFAVASPPPAPTSTRPGEMSSSAPSTPGAIRIPRSNRSRTTY